MATPMKTFVIVASGPSLSDDQIAFIKANRNLFRLIVVNNNYVLFPDADYVVAGDVKWWRYYYDDVCETVSTMTQLHTINGTVHPVLRNKTEVKELHYNNITRTISDLSDDPSEMYHGGCSGILGMELARLEDTDLFEHDMKIILVGFDMQHTNGKSHWFGDHPKGFLNFNCAERWCNEIENMSGYYKNLGIDLVNCTIESAIDPENVRKSTLEEEI